MRIWVDTAVPAEIEEWDAHPWVSGFTTNPTLIKAAGVHPRDVVKLTNKDISIDGPPEVCEWGEHVWQKACATEKSARLGVRVNWTAVTTCRQVTIPFGSAKATIISVFAGRIMDTGRSAQPVIDAAKRTGAQVLWASVREPYNIGEAERAGCDIVTVPPAILRKYLDWHGKPLEVVAEETIAQFAKDAEGITW